VAFQRSKVTMKKPSPKEEGFLKEIEYLFISFDVSV